MLLNNILSSNHIHVTVFSALIHTDEYNDRTAIACKGSEYIYGLADNIIYNELVML